jgi:hypothetical protein
VLVASLRTAQGPDLEGAARTGLERGDELDRLRPSEGLLRRVAGADLEREKHEAEPAADDGRPEPAKPAAAVPVPPSRPVPDAPAGGAAGPPPATTPSTPTPSAPPPPAPPSGPRPVAPAAAPAGTPPPPAPEAFGGRAGSGGGAGGSAVEAEDPILGSVLLHVTVEEARRLEALADVSALERGSTLSGLAAPPEGAAKAKERDAAPDASKEAKDEASALVPIRVYIRRRR